MRFDSRKSLKQDWNPKFGPLQTNLDFQIPIPIKEIHSSSRKLRNPIEWKWNLEKEERQSLSQFFLRVWKKDWAMKVLRNAGINNNGFLIYEETKWRIIFVNEMIGFYSVPDEVEEIKFSFRKPKTSENEGVVLVRYVPKF